MINDMEERNKIIEECIIKIKEMIRPNCDDHTPFRGVCSSCGRHNNPDVIPDIDDLLESLNKMKISE